MIDYAAEYNNRARVPDHPRHIEGWHQDAAAYRAARPDLQSGLAYGARAREVYDWFPGSDPDGPVLLFVHGGYWMAFDGTVFSHLARGPAAHGASVAVISYDLVPHVSLAALTEQIRRAVEAVAARCGRAVTVYGHSAGGHAAAAMLATDWRARGAGQPLVRAAMPISGLFDLEPLRHTPLNATIGLDAEAARALSPLFAPAPGGLAAHLVVGATESGEYLRQTRALAAHWQAGGVAVTTDEVPGAHHFDVIAPLADPDSALTRALMHLARAASR